jgi:hypothetical protein
MSKAKVLALAVTLGTLAFFGPEAGAGEGDALRYNNAVVKLTQGLNLAGRKFGMAIGPALKGQAVDLPKVKMGQQELRKALAGAKKEAAGLKPHASETGRKMGKALERFLKGQEEVVKTDVGDIVRLLEATNPPDAQGSEQLQTIIRRMLQRETPALRDLQQAQEAFAKEHGITLKPKGP